MTFDIISNKIISESINSAVYIDDKVLLPFETPNESLYRNQSELFKAFRKNNCSIDFNRYSPDASINIIQLLNNKDLLILDWHLNGETDLSVTLSILEKAINTQSLHFCVVYTDQRKADLLQNVILNIASYFSGLTNEVNEKCASDFEEFIENASIEESRKKIFGEDIKRLSVELFFEIHNREKNKLISKEINDLLISINIKKEFDAFINAQQFPRVDYKEKIICLGFVLNKCFFSTEQINYKIKISPNDRLTIRINNLYIKVFSKDIKDEELYTEFTKSIIEESNIFLTLLGLEIRNRFRETSGFIGKDLDEVDQLAFFHHRNKHFIGHEHLFNDFLKDIWKEQVASFLLEKYIELFSIIDQYKILNDTDQKLLKFTQGDPKSRESLAKLNLVYNKLYVKRKTNDQIRFGDIFWLKVNEDIVYILCLTPHCDCLRPQKIKNMFFFVEGNDIGVTKGILKSDGDFISYIHNSQNNLTCIDWANGTEDCKPFTFYIENNRMEGSDMKILFNYKGENKSAYYLCTLKESYTQRISNKAFFYPLRVGIDFATFKE